jgi:hypothetical protein
MESRTTGSRKILTICKVSLLVIILGLLIDIVPLQAAIVGAEYFIDTDPGEGNGVPLEAKDGVFDSDAEEVEFELSTDSLGIGLHDVFIRMQSDEGWGTPRVYRIEVRSPATVAGAEYYVNDDPGIGNGEALSAADGVFDSETESLAGIVDTTSLSLDTHTLYLRAMDSDSRWGVTASTTFDVITCQDTEVGLCGNQIDDDCDGQMDCDDSDCTDDPACITTPCTGAAVASSYEVPQSYESSDLCLHLVYLLLPFGVVIAVRIRRTKK